MDLLRVMDVLVICVPVFAILGLGKWLGSTGRMNDEHCSFINWLVYTFSLPALIFNEVARQHFDTFFDPALLLMPILGLLMMVGITMLIAKLNGYKGGFAAAFVFGTFWPNATYVGMPLCQNAFGSEGLAKAAIYNGFILPIVIFFGYVLIGFYGAGEGNVKIGSRIRKAFLNPILLSALLGIVVALIAERFRSESGELQITMPILASASLLGSFLKMIGTMGLPLALLSIGASLQREQTRKHIGALSWSVGCKLIIHPLLTLLSILVLCPDASASSLGVAVILTGTPCAVAMYVISCQLGIERGFVSSMLVLSTALSVITIPIWVYLVKLF